METYTLDELADRVGRALDRLDVRAGNGRVRQRPDARTVRYYTQLGLVDRPLAAAGRTAKYGPRHLAQVVAVKRLQAHGIALADVQRRLTGADDAALLAAIGPDAERALASNPDADGADRPRAADRGRFWRAGPAAATSRAEPKVLSADPVRPRQLLAVALAPGVELTVDVSAAQRVPAVDAMELGAAAAPLIDHLRSTGVLRTDEAEGERL